MQMLHSSSSLSPVTPDHGTVLSPIRSLPPNDDEDDEDDDDDDFAALAPLCPEAG